MIKNIIDIDYKTISNDDLFTIRQIHSHFFQNKDSKIDQQLFDLSRLSSLEILTYFLTNSQPFEKEAVPPYSDDANNHILAVELFKKYAKYETTSYIAWMVEYLKTLSIDIDDREYTLHDINLLIFKKLYID